MSTAMGGAGALPCLLGRRQRLVLFEQDETHPAGQMAQGAQPPLRIAQSHGLQGSILFSPGRAALLLAVGAVLLGIALLARLLGLCLLAQLPHLFLAELDLFVAHFLALL